MRPHYTLIMLAAVGALCLALMLVIPDKGISMGNFSFRFKTFNSIFDTTATGTIEDVGNFLAQYDSLTSDSLVVDSTNQLVVVRKQGIATLQFPNNDSSPLFAFFEYMHQVRDEGGSMHVLHYGDSQIESDRMTSFLREKWQSDFGGGGPGLISPLPVADLSSIIETRSDNWKRYTCYGFDDVKSAHNKYGIMASYARFSPTGAVGNDTLQGWLELKPSRMAQPHCKHYTKAAIYFGNHRTPVTMYTYVLDSLIKSETIAPCGIIRREFYLGYTPSSIKFVFKGTDSPDVHALLFDDDEGVHIDNIPLRGCDGNIFKRINATEIQSQMVDLNTRMVILQFGGNAMPYIDSEARAKAYGKWFQSQIQYMKSIAPQAAFIIVGPADMSTSIDGTYQTYPHLEAVRDAMKEAAFFEGCAYWDMYEVMGGYNSMVSWVNNSPAYAGPDFTHFTPIGARKMAELFYKAIHQEYEAWAAAKGL